MVEVDIGSDGAVREATVLISAGAAFDDAARRAAAEWRFRPARVAGSPRRVFAYLIFAFRAPVVIKPPRAGIPLPLPK